MFEFLFGKAPRKKKSSKAKSNKPRAAVLNKCKKYGVRVTKKTSSGKRVYKSEKVLIKQCVMKKKKMSKKGPLKRRSYPKVVNTPWTVADQTYVEDDGRQIAIAPLDFGKRKYQPVLSMCTKLKKRSCNSNPMCRYAKGKGCRRRKGVVKNSRVYEGPSLPASYTKFGYRFY